MSAQSLTFLRELQFNLLRSPVQVHDSEAANLTRPVKKSELLRAGVAVLNAMTDKAFLAALNGVPSLKTGRPKGSETTSASGKGTK